MIDYKVSIIEKGFLVREQVPCAQFTMSINHINNYLDGSIKQSHMNIATYLEHYGLNTSQDEHSLAILI